jgi:hypothetical protein
LRELKLVLFIKKLIASEALGIVMGLVDPRNQIYFILLSLNLFIYLTSALVVFISRI